jgi:hypothetical protein
VEVRLNTSVPDVARPTKSREGSNAHAAARRSVSRRSQTQWAPSKLEQDRFAEFCAAPHESFRFTVTESINSPYNLTLTWRGIEYKVCRWNLSEFRIVPGDFIAYSVKV